MSAKKRIPRPSIFDFHDYRIFLKEWFQYRASLAEDSSLRKFSEKAGLASGYIPMVLNGKRNLTAKAMAKIEEHLKLNPSEISYLKCLVSLADSNSQEERLIALKSLQKFKTYQKNNIDEVRAYSFLSKWLHVAIREMVHLKDFALDIGWIRNRLVFKASHKEIRNALNFLTENQFLQVQGDGGLELGERHLECVDDVYKSGLTAFHKQMFQLAARSIDEVPSNWRSIYGHTFAISREQVPEVKKVIEEAIQKLSAIDNQKSKNEVVYHATMLAIPITQFEGI